MDGLCAHLEMKTLYIRYRCCVKLGKCHLDGDTGDLSMPSEKDVWGIVGNHRWNKMIEGKQPVILESEGNQVEDDDTFLWPPLPEIINKCIANFIDHTSNAALTMEVCMSCAWTMCWQNTTKYEVSQIPNKELLHLNNHHPSYVLTNGMLLHHKGLEDSDGEGIKGRLCHDCLWDLKLSKQPKFSLVNGMWVREIPFKLSVLTVAEKILIARYYLCCLYHQVVFKTKGPLTVKSCGFKSWPPW